MVSYDIYKNRIQKLAAVKNFIVRFRILIICVIAAILALTSAFLIMKGMVVGGIILPEKIYYGDSFQPEGGKALFSSVFFEYSPAEGNGEAAANSKKTARGEAGESGENWTTVKPDKAGEYLVRTVTFKSFGIIGYGTPLKFKIAPRPVEFLILTQDVVYGAEPDEYVFDLVGDDKLIVTGLTFDFDSFEATITNVCANASSVRVVDKDGNDVTYCYDIITPKKQINLVEKLITVTPVSAEFVYDGSPVPYESLADENTLDLLDEGDRIVIQTEIKNSEGRQLQGAPVEAGNYTAEVSSVKIFKGETEVTERYGITLKTSQIHIAKRPLTISTKSAEREYDGTALIERGFTADGIAEGSGHTAVCNDGNVSITYKGSVPNEYIFGIFDGDDNEVTENYQINYVYGQLSVTARRVTLKTPDAEKVYDARSLSLIEGYSFEGLAEGDIESIIESSSRTQVGESANEFTYCISDKDGNDVTSNYAVTEVWGKLNVTPRTLVINTGRFEKIYDGATVYGDGANGISFDNLAEGSTYRAYEIAEITDAGEIENSTLYEIYFNGEATTENYAVTYERGTLKINRQPLVITTGSGEKTYDGTPLKGSEASAGLTFEGIIDGEYGVADEITELTEAGTLNNGTTYKIYSGNKETTANYSIEYKFEGVITVTSRPLEITTGSAEKEYDGNPFVYTQGYSADNLAEGQTLETDESRREDFAFVTDVNESVENVVYYIVTDGEGNDVTKNYTVTYKKGTISRSPFAVTVTTSTSSRVYDGTPYIDTGKDVNRWTDCGHTLVADESIAPAFVTYATEGERQNEVYYIVTDGEGKDVTYNYALSYEWGTISVNKRPVTIKTGSAEKVYDGFWLEGDVVAPECGNLAEGEILKADADNVCRMRDVLLDWDGTVLDKDNTTVYKVYSDDNETTGNYDVTYVYGKLKIERRSLVITTGSAKKEYDGTTLYGHSESTQADFKGLVQGESYSIYRNYGIIDVPKTDEERQNKTIYDFSSEGRVTTFNYAITYVYGTLEIFPREITVTTATAEWEYDGEVHQLLKEEKVERLLDSNKLVPDKTRETEFAFVKDVKETFTENVVYYIVTAQDGRDITFNYNIKYADWGKISVYARAITIKTADNSWEYDGKTHQQLEGAAADRLLENEPFLHKLVPDETRKEEFASVTEVLAEVTPNVVYYIVQDKDGNVISHNYEIEYVWGKIHITPREIVITTATDSWEYDGQLHQNLEGAKADRLLQNIHRLVPDETRKDEFASVTEVEKEPTQNVVYYIIEDKDGKDISYNYAVNYVWGEIHVYARAIKVVTASKDWVYDGQSHQKLDEFKVDRLLEDEPFLHKLVLDETREEEFASVTYVTEGVKPNAVYYKVLDGNGKDISYNYAIDYSQKGTIQITPRPLAITTITAQKEYDGATLYGDDESYGKPVFDGIVKGESYSADFVAQITNVKWENDEVSSIENNTAYKIFAGNSETTLNYTITYPDNGTLTITPREITVVTNTASWEYNGITHSDTGITATHVKSNGKESDFVLNHTYQAIGAPSILDAGNKENKFEIKILDPYEPENEIVNGNYKVISYTYGTLEVTPREITVVTNTTVWEYDGETHSDTGITATHVKSNGGESAFVLNHTHKALSEPAILNAGEVENKFEINVIDPDEPENETINGNYKAVSYTYGTLTITPREITVTTGSQTWEYDGEAHFNEQVTATHNASEGKEAALVLEHKLVVVSHTEITNAGEVNNTLVCIVTDETVNKNYRITEYKEGTLKVTPREIIVETGSEKWEYDGEEHFNNQATASRKDGLFVFANADRLIVTFHTIIINAGTADNNLVCEVTDKDEAVNAEVNKNYKIVEYVYGTLEITPREITVTTGSQTWEYDGEIHFNEVVTATHNASEGQEAALVSDHELVVISRTEIENVSKVANTLVCIVSDEEINKNYKITEYIEGALEITPRPISVITLDETWEYDGQEHTSRLIRISYVKQDGTTEYGLVSELHSPVLKEQATILNVGSKQNYCLIDKIIDSYDYEAYGKITDYTANYKIAEYKYGTLEVTPREITVVTNTTVWEYDGETHSDTGITATHVKSNGEESAFVLNHTHKALSEPAILNAGEVENEFTIKIIDPDEPENEVINGNYKVVSYTYGTLTITPREIIATTADGTWTYDGNSHMQLEGFGADRLLAGHKMVLDESRRNEFAFILNATDGINNNGRVDNKLYFKFQLIGGTEEQNAIINGNYVIRQYNLGKLTITPKEITVTPFKLDDLVYGQQFKGYQAGVDNYENHLSAGLVGEEKLEISVLFSRANSLVETPKTAGEYTVKIDALNCRVEGGQGKIENYKLILQESKFIISKKPITISLNEVEGKIYDGEQYVYPSENFTSTETAYEEEVTINVIYCDKYGNPVAGNPKDAGEYKIVLRESGCIISDGNSDVKANYVITIDVAEVTYVISRRTITATVNNYEKDYDGSEFNCRPLCEDIGHNITVENYLDGKNLKAHLAVVDDYGNIIEAIQAGDYGLTIAEGWEIKDDKVSNYSLKVNKGVLTVYPRPVTVTVDSSLEYTGEVADESKIFYKASHYDSEYGILENDKKYFRHEYSFNPENPVNIGEYEVNVSFEENDFVKRNYAITYGEGKLKIVERKVTLTAENIKPMEYDGTFYKYADEFTWKHYHADNKEELGFVNGDEANFDINFVLKDASEKPVAVGSAMSAGTYYVWVECSLKSGATDSGYHVECEPQELIIEGRKIYAQATSEVITFDYTKQLPDLSGYYTINRDGEDEPFIGTDGRKFREPVFEFRQNGQTVDPVNAGEYEVYVIGFVFADETAYNYALDGRHAFFAKLVIQPALLLLAPESIAADYTGGQYTLGGDGVKVLNGNLKEGDTIKASFDNNVLSPLSRSESVNITGYTITDGNTGEDVSGNYRVIYSYSDYRDFIGDGEREFSGSDFRGKLEWKRQNVTIVPVAPEEFKNIDYEGQNIEISGEGLFYVNAEIAVETKMNELGHRLEVKRLSTLRKPGVYSDWLTVRVVDANGNDVSFAYEIAYKPDGGSKITVNKRQINVKVNVDEEYLQGTLQDGQYILAANEITLSDSLFDDDQIEVTYLADGTFDVQVFKPRSSKRTDRSEYYNVTIALNTRGGI